MTWAILRHWPAWFARLLAAAMVVGSSASIASAEDAPTGAGSPTPPAVVRRIALDRAEQAMREGRADEAIDEFEQATALQHLPDAEMGIVRAHMQAGHYGLAVSFAAHVAGEHLEAPAATVQYAWLLRIGDQSALATQVLRELRARAPDDPSVRSCAEAFAAALPVAQGDLLELPQRLAPAAKSALPRHEWPVIGGGVLIGADRVVVPAAVALRARGHRMGVRDAFGRVLAATLAGSAGGKGVGLDAPATLATLTLSAPRSALASHTDATLAAAPGTPEEASSRRRLPFAGSAGYLVGYAAAAQGPAWPILQAGFFSPKMGDSGLRALGFAASGGLGGGAVLDAKGDLIGIAIGAGDTATFMPLDVPMPVGPVASSSPVTPSIAYERGMRVAVQIIASP